MENTSTESNAVAFFSFKRADGFVVSLTLRGDSGSTVLSKINTAIDAIKKEGGIPEVKYSYKGSNTPKSIEYVEGRVCPKCREKLIYFEAKGEKHIKCSTARYDWKTKTNSGCDFVEWKSNKNDTSEESINNF